MFSKKELSKLLKNHRATLWKLTMLQAALNERFSNMEDAVECLILSVAAGEPMLLVGPPGTAKSRLIRAFCNYVGMIPDEALTFSRSVSGQIGPSLHEVNRTPSFFTYLLTQFTEPSELFGYFDIGKLLNEPHELVKLDEYAMQRARVVFLDEVFNASSAVLNALLTFMNEREVHDRGTVYKVPLQCLFSATNQTPRTPELKGIFDRFLLRCWLNNERATASTMSNLLRAGWKETHAPRAMRKEQFEGLLDGVIALQLDIEKQTQEGELIVEKDSPLFAILADLVHQVREAELSDASNRRVIKFARVMLISRLLDYAREGKSKASSLEMRREDLAVFLRFGLDRPDFVVVENFRKELQQSQ